MKRRLRPTDDFTAPFCDHQELPASLLAGTTLVLTPDQYAQNVRPKNNVNTKGKLKKTTTEIGTTYDGSQTARATFCVAPIEQTQPSRMKPNQIKQPIDNSNNMRRERRTRARYVAKPSANTNSTMSATCQ